MQNSGSLAALHTHTHTHTHTDSLQSYILKNKEIAFFCMENIKLKANKLI